MFNQKLTKIGIKSIADEDIVYPTLAIISYLKSIHFNKTVYVLGTDAMKLELKEAGFSVVTNEVSLNNDVDVVELSKGLYLHKCF